MNYAKLLLTLTQEPLAILPEAQATLLQLFHLHAELSPQDFQAAREGVGICGQAVEVEQAELIDGVMFIPVGGPIGRGLGKFEKGAGAVDIDDITEELEKAEEDPNCLGSLLDMDTPGGMVTGTPELADFIRNCQKPVFGYTAGMMASAGYWIASSCSQVLATRSADIGSIGVFTYGLDRSKAFEAQGIKAELFASGKYKGMGSPGTKLTDEQRQHLQGRVDYIFGMFADHVREMRPGVTSDTMQGQCFKAEQALQLHLIDGLVSGIDEAADLLRDTAGA